MSILYPIITIKTDKGEIYREAKSNTTVEHHL